MNTLIKFKFPKKSLIFYITTCLSVIAFFSLTFVAYGKLSEQAENNLNKKTIVLDAGHGGEDGGAVGFNDIIEKDINLSISLKLRTLLKSYGYNVIMTREKDESIYDKSSKTLREKKRSDLNNRIKIIKNNEGKNSIFVSIHQNKFPNKKYFGTQIFYSDNNEKSILNEGQVTLTNNWGAKLKSSNFHLGLDLQTKYMWRGMEMMTEERLKKGGLAAKNLIRILSAFY